MISNFEFESNKNKLNQDQDDSITATSSSDSSDDERGEYESVRGRDKISEMLRSSYSDKTRMDLNSWKAVHIENDQELIFEDMGMDAQSRKELFSGESLASFLRGLNAHRAKLLELKQSKLCLTFKPIRERFEILCMHAFDL